MLLQDLPTEILAAIASFWLTTDIKHLCECSRSLRTISTPELYRSIDLSSHNAAITCESRPPYMLHRVPPDFSTRLWTRLDFDVLERQYQFVRMLRRKPDPGRHVRELSWTYLVLQDFCDQHLEDEKMVDEVGYLREEYGGAHEFVDMTDDDPLFQVFRSFYNVFSVEICWFREKREPCLPTPFFTSASKWRISGCMSRELFQHLLSTPSKGLTHLELNNLHQYSDISPPLPSYRTTYGLALYWFRTDHLHTVKSHDRIMSGALDSIVGHCPLLTSLTIITVDEGDKNKRASRVYETAYASWARFLDSVRDTLTFLAFKQGVNRNADETPAGRLYWWRPQMYRHMDMLFREFIWSVLVRAELPRIKRLIIRGVECDDGDEDNGAIDSRGESEIGSAKGKALTMAMQTRLRMLLPVRAELSVVEEQERDYDVPRGLRDGIPVD